MVEPIDNRMALFNELMITCYLYVLMTLTGFNPNGFYNNSGAVLMGVIIFTAGVNFLKFLIFALKSTFRVCRRYCRKKQKKEG